MEIDTTALEALLRQQEQAAGSTSRTQAKAGAFEAALARELGVAELGGPNGAPLPPGAAQAGLISSMLMSNVAETSAVEAENADADLLQDAFAQASGTLDLWDAYTGALGSSSDKSSLRNAYALLQGIDGQVAALKDSTAAVRGKNSGFDSLLNELEVMTATEKFKFNRGDYNA